jgi:hypothetical protein
MCCIALSFQNHFLNCSCRCFLCPLSILVDKCDQGSHSTKFFMSHKRMTNYEINHYQSILERSCIAGASSLVINKGRNAFFVAEVEGLISTSFSKNIRDHFLLERYCISSYQKKIFHFFKLYEMSLLSRML